MEGVGWRRGRSGCAPGVWRQGLWRVLGFIVGLLPWPAGQARGPQGAGAGPVDGCCDRGAAGGRVGVVCGIVGRHQVVAWAWG